MNKRTAFILIPLFYCFMFFLLLSAAASGKRLNHEAHYQEIFCDEVNGEAEVVLGDNTRCDCLTEKHAIEVDFANKWTEGVGQALHYSRRTGKEAGVVLIVEDEDDMKYWDRLNAVIEHFDLPVKTWIIRP